MYQREMKKNNEDIALQLLYKIKKRLNKEKISQILILFLIINPKFNYEKILYWFRQFYNQKDNEEEENDFKKYLKTILITNRGPFSFILDSSIGWKVVLLKESKDQRNDEIVKVPYLTENLFQQQQQQQQQSKNEIELNNKNVIDADIRVGDEINILKYPKLWFVIHEIRPESNSILVITKSDLKKCKLKGREYKEIYCLSLIGCTIKRYGEIHCKYHFPHSCFCQSNNFNSSHLYENNCQHNNQEMNSNNSHHYVIFQFPKPDVSTALESLVTIVNQENESFGGYLEDNYQENRHQIFNNVENDHILKMQRSAYVEIWLQKKQNLIAGQKYLNHIHSTLSLSRLEESQLFLLLFIL